jgi:hypothetical protein
MFIDGLNKFIEYNMKIKTLQEYLPKVEHEFSLMANFINQNIVPKARTIMIYNLENIKGIQNCIMSENYWIDVKDA